MVMCACGELIDHTCPITNSGQTRMIFQTCGYETWKAKKGDECEVCMKKENFQKYLDSSYTDQDGYEYCSFCHEHAHCCSCVAFVDMDGKKKCKKCKELWTGPDVESGECESEVCVKEKNYEKYLDSRYDRDGYVHCSFYDKSILSCTCAAFVDIDGLEKCKKCKTLWNVPYFCEYDCGEGALFVDIDGVEKCEKCKCKCQWNTDPSEIMSGKCESCGFNGDT